MLGEAVGKPFDFGGFDVGGFDDGLAFAIFLEVLFVAAGDCGDFGDDFFAEAEEDVGVGLFEIIPAPIGMRYAEIGPRELRVRCYSGRGDPCRSGCTPVDFLGMFRQ